MSYSPFVFTMSEAIDYAKAKHGATKRKFGNVPYVDHPLSVAKRISGADFRNEVVVAAVLHDTVEDTDATLKEIREKFGNEVGDLVSEVTSDRAAIAAIDSPIAKGKYLVAKMNGMTSEAFAIKLADREDNVSDLAEASAEFSSRYAASTRYILDNVRAPKNDFERELFSSIYDKISPFLSD